MRTTIASAMLFAFLVGCGLEGPVPQKKEQAASNTPTPGAPAQESKQPDKLTGPKNRPADSGSPGSQEPKQVDKFAGTANNADNPARQQATSSWSPDPALLAKLRRPNWIWWRDSIAFDSLPIVTSRSVLALSWPMETRSTERYGSYPSPTRSRNLPCRCGLSSRTLALALTTTRSVRCLTSPLRREVRT